MRAGYAHPDPIKMAVVQARDSFDVSRPILVHAGLKCIFQRAYPKSACDPVPLHNVSEFACIDDHEKEGWRDGNTLR